MDLKSLEARIQHLEDVEAIKTLKALCCHVVDIKDGAGFARLFVEDGVFIGAFQQHRRRSQPGSFRRHWQQAG